MHANKFTGQNFEREMAMATTLIENIVNELTELVVQSVMKEFQAQEARLTVLEKGFETLAQQKLKGLTDPLDHEARLNALERVDLEYEVTNIIDRYNMTPKIEDTLRDFDLGVEEAVEDEIRNRTLVTEDDLIEFINDRVRITVE